jgi:hypothetical protein
LEQESLLSVDRHAKSADVATSGDGTPSCSAIIVPKPHLRQVAVLVRCSVGPLTPADLEQAVTLLHAPPADAAISQLPLTVAER